MYKQLFLPNSEGCQVRGTQEIAGDTGQKATHSPGTGDV